MRRLAVAFLAVGCLALVAGTMSVQAQLVGGDISFALCGSGTYDEEVCDNGKVRYCHFNEGGEDRTGKAHCGNESSYAAHVGPGIVVGHSQKDFCITNAQEEADCLAGKSPVPDPK